MTRYSLLAGSLVLLFAVGTCSAQDAPALTKDELQQMLPGSQVASTGVNGHYRTWENQPDGTLVAYARGRKKMKTATGNWHVSDDGDFCVHIEWNSHSERWCAPVQKTGKGKYALVRAAATEGSEALPPQLEIRK